MKKYFLLLLYSLTSIFASAQGNTFPGITEAQKQKLIDTKIAVPLPTWLPDGFAVSNIVTKTGRSVSIENKVFDITYSKKAANGQSLKFSIEAGFEGLGDLPYDGGETIKSKVGNIYLYYEPLDEDENGKKVKTVGFIMTEWFVINKLSFHVSFNAQNANEKPDNRIPKLSKADVKKILQSLEILK